MKIPGRVPVRRMVLCYFEVLCYFVCALVLTCSYAALAMCTEKQKPVAGANSANTPISPRSETTPLNGGFHLLGDSVNSKNPQFGNPKFRTTHIFLGKFRDRVRALFLNFRRTSKFRISKFRLFRIYGVTHLVLKLFQNCLPAIYFHSYMTGSTLRNRTMQW
jgi:hypothetical protein